MALLAVITLMILPASTVMTVLCANLQVYLRSETTLDRLDRYLSDTRVTRLSDDSLTTTIFRKKTHSDHYLEFDSYHPLTCKVAGVRTLQTKSANQIGIQSRIRS